MRPTCPPTSEPSARRPRALLTVAFANAGANASPEMRERRRAATADPCVLWPLPVPLRSAHGNRTWDWGECQMEVPMQVGVPTHRKLMRDNCGVRAAHSARDGARPQPLTLAFWPLPVPLTGLHMWEWNMGVVERLPNGLWNWYGMGIQWCSWWILWDFDLCSQLETTCDRPSCGTPQAQCDRESPAAA